MTKESHSTTQKPKQKIETAILVNQIIFLSNFVLNIPNTGLFKFVMFNIMIKKTKNIPCYENVDLERL